MFKTLIHSLKLKVKHILPQTLFGRSMMIIITPVLLLQIIASFVFVDRHWAAMSDRFTASVSGEISMLIEQIKNSQSIQETAVIIDLYARNVQLMVTYENDITITETPATSLWPTIETSLTQSLKKYIDQPFIVQPDNKAKWYEILISFEKGGGLRIRLPERRLFSSTSYIFILWLFGSSFILFAIAAVFMRNQVRPIKKLSVAADRFGKGVDVPKFKPHGAQEVRQAAHAFLDMRDRIKRQIEQRTEMLAGVSHDLRTPITRMKLQLELLGDSPDAQALRDDLTEMEIMIEGYLSFVRGEGDEASEAIDMINLVEKLLMSARRQGRIVNDDINRDNRYICRVRPNAIERSINNLINNACKYGEQVFVSMHLTDDESVLEISIDDNGPGIPETSFKDVFKPFFRVDKSRNCKTGGVGLGLAISKDIIHSHGGEILLSKSSKHGGLRVLVRLPL